MARAHTDTNDPMRTSDRRQDLILMQLRSQKPLRNEALCEVLIELASNLYSKIERIYFHAVHSHGRHLLISHQTSMFVPGTPSAIKVLALKHQAFETPNERRRNRHNWLLRMGLEMKTPGDRPAIEAVFSCATGFMMRGSVG